MHRMPLVDQLPYQFLAPRFGRFWWLAGRPFNSLQILRREQKVVDLDIQGSEHLKSLLGRGDGVMITPNHPDRADPGCFFEASHRLKQPFSYLAAFQLFQGTARFLLPRVGVFPVDREGADLRAFKAGVDVLVKARFPLVIFPEGEVYSTSDRLTPIREGAVAMASAASRRLSEAGKTAWIVPAAVKYRFVEDSDPLPALVEVMDRLEARFTWWPDPDLPLVERIYKYAEGLLGLKELELLGAARTGPIKERVASLRDSILDRIEDKRSGKRRDDHVPVRIKELRRACLEALRAPGITPGEVAGIRRDLNDIFVALQLFSYPGDYVQQQPTLERVAETLLKFEQDTLGMDAARPRCPRRAIVRFGEPIDVGRRLAELGKSRLTNGRITAELEGRIQGLLDEIGPGRPIPSRSDSSMAVGTSTRAVR